MTVERVTWNNLKFASEYSSDIVINFTGFYVAFRFGGSCVMRHGNAGYFSDILVET